MTGSKVVWPRGLLSPAALSWQGLRYGFLVRQELGDVRVLSQCLCDSLGLPLKATIAPCLPPLHDSFKSRKLGVEDTRLFLTLPSPFSKKKNLFPNHPESSSYISLTRTGSHGSATPTLAKGNGAAVYSWFQLNHFCLLGLNMLSPE